MLRIFSLFALLFSLAACQPEPEPLAQEATPPDFAVTVQRHADAVTGRDMNALLATVTEGEALTLIFPDGTRLTTRDEYVAFHEEWFADSTWAMDIETVSVNASAGTAVVRTSYVDDGPESRRDAWLSLVFALEKGAWRLVHDQNTRIPAGG